MHCQCVALASGYHAKIARPKKLSEYSIWRKHHPSQYDWSRLTGKKGIRRVAVWIARAQITLHIQLRRPHIWPPQFQVVHWWFTYPGKGWILGSCNSPESAWSPSLLSPLSNSLFRSSDGTFSHQSCFSSFTLSSSCFKNANTSQVLWLLPVSASSPANSAYSRIYRMLVVTRCWTQRAIAFSAINVWTWSTTSSNLVTHCDECAASYYTNLCCEAVLTIRGASFSWFLVFGTFVTHQNVAINTATRERFIVSFT